MPWLLILAAVGLIVLIPTAYAGYIGAPYAPTRKPAIHKAFDLVGVGKEDQVVDLGAGDGKALLVAARRGARAIGYELSPLLWAVASLRTLGRKGVSVKLGNFFKQQLPPDTTHIFFFLMPENMEKMQRFLERQELPHLKSVMSYAFVFPEMPPLHIVQTERAGRVFVYDAEAFRSTDDDA